MANEFTRKETATDYQTYAGREGSRVDFSEEADKITTAVKAVATDRQDRKDVIQTDTDNVIIQLSKAEDYTHQTLNQTVLKQARNLKKEVLRNNKLMQAGHMTPAEYMAFLQTSKDSLVNWGILAKNFDKTYIAQQARQGLGEDGIKIASGVETYMNGTVFQNKKLDNVDPFTAPNGVGFLVRMNVDEAGNKTMPDFDTERHKYLPMPSMNDLINYQDNGNKYDIPSLVKRSNANIGDFITSTISGYTVSQGGGVVTTVEGARQMAEYLKTVDGDKAFTALMQDTVDVVLNSDLSVVNALRQRPGVGKDKYIIAQTEKEFREKGGTDLSKFIRIVPTDSPPTFPDLSEEQEQAAIGMVEREFLTQLGQSTKKTKGLSGQQENTSTTGTTTKDVNDAGYISELNDAFTNPDTGKAKAIIKRLVDSRNSEITKPEDRIRSVNIEDSRIVVKRAGGQDDLIIERVSDSGIIDDPNTLDIDEGLTNISTEDDIMSLIDILTPGNGISRGRFRKLIKEQNITLGEKRAGSIYNPVARSPLSLITNTTKLPNGQSVISSLDGVIGSTTRGQTDATIVAGIDEVIVNAMSNTLKREISSFKLGDAETQRIDIDGKSYLKVKIAGIEVDILLEGNNTKENIAKEVVGIINSATAVVNKRREKGRSGKEAGMSYTEWKKENKTGTYKEYQAQRV